MNDVELDRLLDMWQAPVPAPSLRTSLRDRFPHPVRRRFGRPLRWVLVLAAAATTLAIATEQSSGNPVGYLFGRIETFVLHLRFGLEVRQATAILLRIRDSNPKVFIDGQPAPSPEVNGRYLAVHVPGDGLYQVILFHAPEWQGWAWTGSVHGNLVEFDAGGRRVRIECDRQVFSSEHRAYTRHLPK